MLLILLYTVIFIVFAIIIIDNFFKEVTTAHGFFWGSLGIVTVSFMFTTTLRWMAS